MLYRIYSHNSLFFFFPRNFPGLRCLSKCLSLFKAHLERCTHICLLYSCKRIFFIFFLFYYQIKFSVPAHDATQVTVQRDGRSDFLLHQLQENNEPRILESHFFLLQITASNFFFMKRENSVIPKFIFIFHSYKAFLKYISMNFIIKTKFCKYCLNSFLIFKIIILKCFLFQVLLKDQNNIS